MTLQEFAYRLADQRAVDVVLGLPVEVLDGRVWRDADKADPPVHWEVKYLRMRGLLMHNAARPNLVIVRIV